MAILCVTLNPCLDKTLTVPPWRAGDMVRGQAVRLVVGGKGNNVARALVRLGRSATAVHPVTFLGGPIGTLCEALLRDDDGLAPLVVRTTAPTREILTVRTGESAEQTSFFDPDPAIQPAEAGALRALVERTIEAGGVEALTLSGSSPSAATHALSGDLIALARAAGVPVFLDSYGPALRSVGDRLPDALQLNRREAGQFLGQPQPDEAAIRSLLADWAGRGVTTALVTDGPEAVLVCLEGQFFKAWPPRVEVVNPVGSGDSLLAGLVDATLQNREPLDRLRRAVACGVANALTWDAGRIEPEQVRALTAQVRIEPWVPARV